MTKLLNLFFLIASSLFLSNPILAQTIQTKREPQFENKEVKVWKSIITPHTPLKLHRHDHPRVLIALTDGTIKLVEENGHSEMHHWQAGQAYWLPANPPHTLHTDDNIGDKPVEVIVVELKNEQ